MKDEGLSAEDKKLSTINIQLSALARQYETREFLDGDPSWFMHQVEGEANKELLAFIASALSYGSRKQFLPKIQYILDCSEGNVEGWLRTKRFRKDIPDNEDCYYRLYTNHTMYEFLDSLTTMIEQYGSLKNYVREEFLKLSPTPSRQALDAIKAITHWFCPILHYDSDNAKESQASSCRNYSRTVSVIPKDTTSSCKRICMFLRWMVRDNSPVDLGLWADIIDKRTLIIPLDTHVMQEANRLGLISTRTTSMATAIKLTERLKEIFPDDPLKGDFALFGVGVDAQ